VAISIEGLKDYLFKPSINQQLSLALKRMPETWNIADKVNRQSLWMVEVGKRLTKRNIKSRSRNLFYISRG